MTDTFEPNALGPDGAASRCGFVAILGAPNAGKSSLMNKLVGVKVSIVSPKVQTTRTRVLGILLEDEAQIIFVDTPGIFAPKKRLDRAMVSAAWQGATDAEEVLVMVDAARKNRAPETDLILEGLKDQKRQARLVLNKVDLIKRDKLLAQAAELNHTGLFTHTYMVSTMTGDGLDFLARDLHAAMPQGPWMYPEDQVSDMPIRLLAAEITREKMFLSLHQELPYSATVETEQWEERPNGTTAISQTIYVERESQRRIVLGKGGQQIKKIGMASRTEIEEIVEGKVHLSLFVKVRERWQDDPERYGLWGLDHGA